MINQFELAIREITKNQNLGQLTIENQHQFEKLFLLGVSFVGSQGGEISRTGEFFVAMISGALIGSLFSAGLMAILLRARARMSGREKFLTAGEMKLIGRTALGGAIIGGLFTGTTDAFIGCPMNDWTGMCAGS
jgi:hypothetical protein